MVEEGGDKSWKHTFKKKNHVPVTPMLFPLPGMPDFSLPTQCLIPSNVPLPGLSSLLLAVLATSCQPGFHSAMIVPPPKHSSQCRGSVGTCLTPSLGSLLRNGATSCTPLCTQSLVRCLGQRKHSVNTCWINKWEMPDSPSSELYFLTWGREPS